MAERTPSYSQGPGHTASTDRRASHGAVPSWLDAPGQPLPRPTTTPRHVRLAGRSGTAQRENTAHFEGAVAPTETVAQPHPYPRHAAPATASEPAARRHAATAATSEPAARHHAGTRSRTASGAAPEAVPARHAVTRTPACTSQQPAARRANAHRRSNSPTHRQTGASPQRVLDRVVHRTRVARRAAQRRRARNSRNLAPYLVGGAALVLVAVLVIGIGSLAWSALFPAVPATETETQAPLVDDENNILLDYDISESPVSTARAAWAQGTMPHLYQRDIAWADAPYAGGTVAANACGPTCMTMVYIYLTGSTAYDPASMSAFADANNYAPTGATEWRFMTEGAAQLGIKGWMVNPTRAAITAELEAGHPVILSVRPGDFTTVGHFIVLAGIDERGMVTVHDPNSVMNSITKWGIATLCNQAAMAWAFSA